MREGAATIQGKCRRGQYLGQIWGIMAKAHHIVFANEKGGTGKSTTAIHVAIALASRGARVACIDLDSRQRTLYRYLENRRDTMARRKVTLPMPVFEVFEHDSQATLERQVERLGAENDFLVFDTPGRDDPYARFVATRANTLVTPINDSFVDFDLLAHVDAETGKVKGPSIYSEMVWNARQLRAQAGLKPIDWIVLRNRLGAQAMHNKRKVGAALEDLSRRIGFRVVPGFAERVIFRELFPRGLTVLDLKDTGVDQMNLSNVAARQEVRELMKSLRLPNVTVDF